MKRVLIILPALALAACSPAPVWQVVSVRTSADPATETGLSRLRIDDHRFSGTTGCADVAGEFDGGSDGGSDGDDTITLRDIALGDPGNCTGWARHTHDQLAPLIVDGATFRVRHPSDFEIVLVGDLGETVRLMQE